ncbi:hypothetical protein [Streptomyces sp. NPDC003299]
MAVIIAPVEGYSGPGVGGLTFADGRAETNSETVIAYARRHGYTIEDDAPAEKPGRSRSKTTEG